MESKYSFILGQGCIITLVTGKMYILSALRMCTECRKFAALFSEVPLSSSAVLMTGEYLWTKLVKGLMTKLLLSSLNGLYYYIGESFQWAALQNLITSLYNLLPLQCFLFQHLVVQPFPTWKRFFISLRSRIIFLRRLYDLLTSPIT